MTSLLQLVDAKVKYMTENGVSLPKPHDFVVSLCDALSRPPLFTTLRIHADSKSPMTAVKSIHHQVEEIVCEQYKEKGVANPAVFFHPDIPDLLIIENKGLLERSPCRKEVVVDHLCGCAVLRGADVFAQGILGAHSNIHAGDKVSVYADIDGKCLKGYNKVYSGSKVFIGNGIAQVSRNDIFEGDKRPSGIGVKITEPLYAAPSLSDILPEQVFPQNLPSAVAAHVLSPLPGETILDMCAAPGGKTVHIGALMNNEGKVIAFDKTQGKIDKINTNCKLLRVTNVSSYVFDGTRACSSKAEHFDVHRSVPPFPAEFFDRIMLDAPCSAIGQRPTLVNKTKVKELESYPKLQKQLFSVAVDLLKKNGTLVYSTCTVTLTENEELVAWALKKYPCLKLVKQNPHVGGHGYRTDDLTMEQSLLLQRFDPSPIADTDFMKIATREQLVNTDTIGFFIAKFVKS